MAAARDQACEVVDAELVQGLPPPGSRAAALREQLLSLASGLDRGSRASAADAAEVSRLATALAAEAAAEKRWRLSFPADLAALEGRWRLLYTSAFAGRSAGLGGLRPGPPLESPLAEVSGIFQRYRVGESKADTVVELRPPKWLRQAGLLDSIPFLPSARDGGLDATLTLTQTFGLASNDTLRFAFSDGQAQSKLLEQLGALKFPMTVLGIPPDVSSDGPATDTLQTIYCDGELRIGVGGRFGEQRLFLREPA